MLLLLRQIVVHFMWLNSSYYCNLFVHLITSYSVKLLSMFKNFRTGKALNSLLQATKRSRTDIPWIHVRTGPKRPCLLDKPLSWNINKHIASNSAWSPHPHPCNKKEIKKKEIIKLITKHVVDAKGMNCWKTFDLMQSIWQTLKGALSCYIYCF